MIGHKRATEAMDHAFGVVVGEHSSGAEGAARAVLDLLEKKM